MTKAVITSILLLSLGALIGAQSRTLERLESTPRIRYINSEVEPAKTHAECAERNGAWVMEVDDELNPIGAVCVDRK